MSRINELRSKLRSKPIDKDFINFDSAVEDYLEKCGASASFSQFTRNLYKKYKFDNPKDLQSWLSSELMGKFISERASPIWLDEPDWCFLEDQPMEFVHQFSDNDGRTFYVFRGSIASSSGDRDIFKMIAHRREGKVVLEGEIRA